MRRILQGRDGRLFGWVAGAGSFLLLPLLWARWGTVTGYGVLPGDSGSSPTGPLYRYGPTVVLSPFRDGFVVPPVIVAAVLATVLICAASLAAARYLRARIGAGAGLLGAGAALVLAFIGPPGWILPAGQLHGLPSCQDVTPCAIWRLEAMQQLLLPAAAILMACGAAGSIRALRWAGIERGGAAATSTKRTVSDALVLVLLIAAAGLATAILAIINLALHPFTF